MIGWTDDGYEVAVESDTGGIATGTVRHSATGESYAFRCEHFAAPLLAGMDGGRIAALAVRDPDGRDIIAFAHGAWTLEPRGYAQKTVLRAIYSKFN